jgi:hypothetical protein
VWEWACEFFGVASCEVVRWGVYVVVPPRSSADAVCSGREVRVVVGSVSKERAEPREETSPFYGLLALVECLTNIAVVCRRCEPVAWGSHLPAHRSVALQRVRMFCPVCPCAQVSRLALAAWCHGLRWQPACARGRAVQGCNCADRACSYPHMSWRFRGRVLLRVLTSLGAF